MYIATGEFYGISPYDEDGLKTVFHCFVMVEFGIVFFVGPGTFFVLNAHPEMIPTILCPNSNIGILLVSLYLGWNIFNLYLGCFIFVATLFIFFKGNIDWLRRMRYGNTKILLNYNTLSYVL